MPPIWKSHLDSLQITSLADIFRTAKPVIGMVHCWPMPGAPGYQGYGMRDIIRHAQSDAEALIAGGCDGIIVENMWDIPFRAGAHIPPKASPHTQSWPPRCAMSAQYRWGLTWSTTAVWPCWPLR